MASRKLNRPTDGELEILAVLWTQGVCTVRDVWDTLNNASPLDRSTVAKRVDAMVDKNLVKVVDDRRPQKFAAVLDQKKAYQSYAKDLMIRFFGASTARLMTRLDTLNRPKDELKLKKLRDQIDELFE